MGENVLKGQVKNFKKGRDRAMEKMGQPTLFDRPDVVTVIYTAAPVDGRNVAQGDRVHAHIAADCQSVRLAKGHEVVGDVTGDGATTLLRALGEPGSPGCAPMNVVEVSPVSGFIKVVVDNKDDSQ